jgi:hypothetical protein
MLRLPLTAVLIAIVGVAGACGLPSDVSQEFTVVMDEDVLVITVGDTVVLGAVVQRGAQTAPDIPIAYTTSDPTVVDVREGGLIRGVSIGQAEVTARAVGLENTQPATRTVRVLRSVAIESVRPMTSDTPDGRTVSWGEVVEIAGVGLNPDDLNLIFVNDRPAPIHSYVAAPPEDETASDTLRIWIPASVPEQSSILLSRRGGSTAAWPLTVRQEDVLEPNDFTRHTIPLGSGSIDLRGLALEVRPWPPGMFDCWSAFGGTEPDNCFSDGYTVEPTTRDVTIVVSFPDASVQTAPVSVELGDGTGSDLVWTVQRTFSFCGDFSGTGFAFGVVDHIFTPDADSLVFPIRDAPAAIDFDLTLFGEPTSIVEAPTGNPVTTAYDLRIHPGYRSALAPDAMEENDWCHVAGALPYPSGSLDLNFDHGHDLDWFGFSIPGVRPDLGAVNEVPESETNDAFVTADTIGFGDRATGAVSFDGDADYFAFQADSADWVDIEVIADRTEQSSLNSLLQLFYQGEQLALNDDLSFTTFDSRITTQVHRTGWYIISLQDTNGRGRANATYNLDLRRLGPESNAVTLTATGPVDATDAEFGPFIQVWIDDRANDGEINLLVEDAGEVNTVLTPGDYLVLVYNKAGQPIEYELAVNGRPLG